MERLQIDVPTGLRAQLKAEAKAKGMFLQSYVNEVLESRSKAKVRTITGTALIVEPEDKRDPKVQSVVDHFEKQVGKMPRIPFQRRAAKTLIQRHSYEKVIGAINAVKQSRGERFAPSIASLESLRDKWVELENYWQREFVSQSKQRTVKI